MENYEYRHGSFVSTESIFQGLKEVAPELEDPDKSVIGKIIVHVWRNKVAKSKTTSVEGSGYKHLSLRSTSSNRKHEITKFDEETVKAIRGICSNNEGWMSDVSLQDKGVISLFRVPHLKREEDGTDVIVDGHRVLMELIINLSPSVHMTLRTHGEPVPIEDILVSFGNDGLVSIHAIDTVIRVLVAAFLCLGEEISTDADSDLQVPVLGSQLANVKIKSVDTKRLISSSCLLLVSIGTSCQNCYYANRLYNNRENKRKRADQVETNWNKRKERYLNRSGLENKIIVQKKQKKSAGVAKKEDDHDDDDEMLAFEESDHKDLSQIFEGIDKSKIPNDMQLLWDMQVQQLAAKSPKGYRWHPRLV